MWSAEEFKWKLAGLLAGNTKGFLYLESKVKSRVNQSSGVCSLLPVWVVYSLLT